MKTPSLKELGKKHPPLSVVLKFGLCTNTKKTKEREQTEGIDFILVPHIETVG
jgi:hypothetical protein